MIFLDNISLNFPVYSHEALSFKRLILGQTDPKKPEFIKALTGINLEIRPGDRIGLIGSNGAGKSTLLRVIAGIYEPTEGTISCEKKVTTLLGLGIGAHMENHAFNNIKILLGSDGIKPSEIDLEQIWKFTELDEKFKHIPMRSFSSGMVMRLLFSAVTHFQPQILLLDEWLSVVDHNFAQKSARRMKQVVDNTEMLVLASHDHNLIKRTCNRILKLENGKVIEVDNL